MTLSSVIFLEWSTPRAQFVAFRMFSYTTFISSMTAVWIVIAIISSASLNLYNRYTLKDNHVSPYAFALVNNFIGVLLFVPIVFINVSYPQEGIRWIGAIIAGTLWALSGIASAHSHKHTHASVRAPLGQSKLIWALLGALFGGGVAIADKYALGFFSPETYGFFGFFIPGIILLPFAWEHRGDIQRLLIMRKARMFGNVALAVVTYYSILRVYAVLPVSVAYPLLQVAMICTVIGGIVFFHERDRLLQKGVATIVVIAGAVLLKLV